MSVEEQIKEYITSQPEQKRIEMETLHQSILQIFKGCKLWFLDGKDEKGKTVSNPNIGYGVQTLTSARNKSREFYQIGLSGNKSGISVYIMGLNDKTYLSERFGDKLGKATITGYCVRFKSLKDINIDVLKSAIRERAGVIN